MTRDAKPATCFASAGAATGYDGYAAWKAWDGDFRCSERDARYYAAEFRGVPVAGRRVLEIGFGNGAFLAWARGQGAEVVGTELLREMRDAGERQGYVVSDASVAELHARGERFDVVVAFDVFEHWDSDELIANVRCLAAMLTDGGAMLARFPNGHSPFGRIYQHGDFTHRTVLSHYKIGWLAADSGLVLVRESDAARVPSKRGLLRALKYRLSALQRRAMERRLSRLYGMARLPLGPNLVVVLAKPAPPHA